MITVKPKTIKKVKTDTENKTASAEKKEKKIKKPSVPKEVDLEAPKLEIDSEAPVLPSQGKEERYYEAIGRRKTAVARVRLFTKGDKVFIVNDKPINEYFREPELLDVATSSMTKMKSLDRFRIVAKASGGGLRGQAEAIRHGSARVLVQFNPDYQKRLRRAGYLTRDSRMKERKKFGLKRARKAPQWAKR